VAEEMRRDASVVMFGAGMATRRSALREEFGAARVRHAPLAEGLIAGMATAAAASGLRPVVDLLFAPCLALDQIVDSAGKLRPLAGGQVDLPMVVLAMTGSIWPVCGRHQHHLAAWFAQSPALNVVTPATAADCKGLMKAAIRANTPVMFFVDLALAHTSGAVGDAGHVIPIGTAALRRAGSDITLVAYAKTVHHCLSAADTLARFGVEAEVIDLRSIKPLDQAAIVASVRKTGRLLVVHEASALRGIGAEIAALVADQACDALKTAHAPAHFVLEQAFVPHAGAIIEQALQLVGLPVQAAA
jgi:pyruvate dehydrogenase E1 component beta subunit